MTARTLPLLLMLMTLPASAQDHHDAGAGPISQQPSRRLAIRNVPVRTETGSSLHFYDELVRGRLVVINFIFTSCSTVCPLMGTRVAALDRLLSARGADIPIISVSIDPATDTSARLAAWKAKFGGASRWTLVTGQKASIDLLLTSLGATAGDPASHAPLLIVVDDRTGFWQRLDGLADPARVDAILRARPHSQQAGSGAVR